MAERTQEERLSDELMNSHDDIVALQETIKEREAKIAELEEKLKKAEAKQPSSKKAEPGDKIQWIKTGGGSHRLGNGTIIKPNQRFWATSEEIPESFRNIIKPVSGEMPEQAAVISSTKYEIQTKGVGWFNVVNIANEKIMNEKGLRREDADKLLAELS